MQQYLINHWFINWLRIWCSCFTRKAYRWFFVWCCQDKSSDGTASISTDTRWHPETTNPQWKPTKLSQQWYCSLTPALATRILFILFIFVYNSSTIIEFCPCVAILFFYTFLIVYYRMFIVLILFFFAYLLILSVLCIYYYYYYYYYKMSRL